MCVVLELLSILFLAHLSFADGSGSKASLAQEDCGAPMRLDQRNQDGSEGSMMHVPVLDQGEIYSCWSFSSAELIQAWMCSHGDCNRPPAAISIAIDAAMNNSGSDRTFLNIEESRAPSIEINELMDKKIGFCSNEIWGRNFDEKKFDTLNAIFEAHKKYEQELKKALGDSAASRVVPVYLGSGIDRDTRDANSVITCLREGGVSIKDLPHVDFVKRILNDTDPLVFARDLLAKGCDKAHFLPKLPPMKTIPVHEICAVQDDPNEKARCLAGKEAASIQSGRAQAPSIIKNILKNGQPVLVGYCSEVIDKDGEGASYQPDPHYDHCSGHGSLIMGNRKNPQSGKCQYLVRNVWGAGCGLNPDWECDKDSAGNYDGDFWIDTNVLMRATLDISYFSDGK